MEHQLDMSAAYEGSYYTIVGAGGDLDEWTKGYQGILDKMGTGHITCWYQTTGAAANAYAATRGTVTNPFQDDVTILMFPLNELDGGKLAYIKLQMQDRWFDDVVNNMVAWEPDAGDDDDEDL